jgi:hypothetical protein
VRPSPLHAGAHATILAGGSRQSPFHRGTSDRGGSSENVSSAGIPGTSPTRSPSPFAGTGSEFDSGRSEDGIVVGQLSSSESGGDDARDDARDDAGNRDALGVQSDDVSSSDSATASSDESDPDTQREAALLQDFAYTNLSQLAQQNMATVLSAARSRGATPRVSLTMTREPRVDAIEKR